MRHARDLLLACALALSASAAWGQSGYQPPPPPMRIPGKELDQLRQQENSGLMHTYARPSGNPLQIRAATRLAETLKVPCVVSDAAELANRKAKAANGATVQLVSYEIACKDALGWIITQQSDGAVQTLDCLALTSAAKAAGKSWPKGFTCQLPANGAPLSGLRAIAARAAPGCALSDAVFVGSGGQPPINRYELSCEGGGGFLVDAPAPGSTARLEAIPCAQAAALGAQCALPASKPR